MIFAIICDVFHDIKYHTTVTASPGCYFEKKMDTELSWRQRQRVLLLDEVKRLSQVNWCDVGMHAALSFTDMEDLVSKNASSPIQQYFRYKAAESGEPKDSNEALCHFC